MLVFQQFYKINNFSFVCHSWQKKKKNNNNVYTSAHMSLNIFENIKNILKKNNKHR